MQDGVSYLATGGASPPIGRPCGVAHPYSRQQLGLLTQASIAFGQEARLPPPARESAKRGVRYEGKVVSYLTASYPDRFIPGLPFQFDGYRKAIPDGLLFSSCWRAVAVVEVKLRHSGDAFHQLHNFYLPIVKRALKGAFEVQALEICRFYDPTHQLPLPVTFLDAPDEVFQQPAGCYPLLVFQEPSRWTAGSTLPSF